MVCIIAANQMWHSDLPSNLQKRTNKEFLTITSADQLTEARVINLHPEYIFFPHWSYIIPTEIFKSYECIIFHMTDLPFGRGGSPLQNLVARNIYETYISALRCEENIDSGPIYLKKPLTLQGRAQDIYYQANRLIEDMIVEIVLNKLTPVPQSGEVVTFRRRKPEEGNLAPLDNLRTVYDYIRMLDAKNYPPAFIETEHLRFEFSRASFQDDKIIADVIIQQKREE